MEEDGFNCMGKFKNHISQVNCVRNHVQHNISEECKQEAHFVLLYKLKYAKRKSCASVEEAICPSAAHLQRETGKMATSFGQTKKMPLCRIPLERQPTVCTAAFISSLLAALKLRDVIGQEKQRWLHCIEFLAFYPASGLSSHFLFPWFCN